MKTYKFKINNDKYVAKILEYKGDSVIVEVNNGTYHVEIEHEKTKAQKLIRSEKPVNPVIPSATPKKVQAGAGSVVAPIPGQIHSILVKEGDSVNSGEPVIILEAMKMESEINAVASGKIKKIAVKQGENVQEGQLLLEIGD
jgi:biotin carboxyl carrier protein